MYPFILYIHPILALDLEWFSHTVGTNTTCSASSSSIEIQNLSPSLVPPHVPPLSTIQYRFEPPSSGQVPWVCAQLLRCVCSTFRTSKSPCAHGCCRMCGRGCCYRARGHGRCCRAWGHGHCCRARGRSHCCRAHGRSCCCRACGCTRCCQVCGRAHCC